MDRDAAVDLVKRIVALSGRLGALHHELVCCIAEYDNSGMWAMAGYSTCAGWAADTLGVSVGTAREWVRVGHAIAELREIERSFGCGTLSYSQVRTLTRIAVDHPEREHELVLLAESTPPRHLAIALARWTSHNEDPHVRERRHRRETAMSSHIEPDGMGFISLRLPPLQHGAVMAAIDAAVLTTESADCASTDAQLPRTVTERSTLAQQRAAALVNIVTTGGATVATEVIVHVRADGATLDDGTPVAGSLVEQILPSSLLRAMIHDAAGHPINVSGTHRHPTTRQRRVVKERDRTCSCGAVAFLEFHHEPPYQLTGRTLIDELELKCSKCHRQRHERDADGWRRVRRSAKVPQ